MEFLMMVNIYSTILIYFLPSEISAAFALEQLKKLPINIKKELKILKI